MADQGYYRSPTICGETVVFVSEDDLWAVQAGGGVARRLTANPGAAASPALSPDGALLAFVGHDEGSGEVYVMPAAGGEARRLTFLGAETRVCGWSPDGREIIFSSTAGRPFPRTSLIYAVPYAGGEPRLLPTGPAVSASLGPSGGMVIARNNLDPARWKRYRGGRTGDLWVDPDGAGEWRRLIALDGNVTLPLWVGERIYFISDHEGVGNIYSCLPTGEDVRRHTRHREFYARFPASDGRRIVYHAGADLYLFDPASDTTRKIEVEYHSPRAQRKRRFVDPTRYLQGYHLHPEGHTLALLVRGKPFTFGCWEGAVLQHGEEGAVRYRLPVWLNDGRRIALVSDATGEETLELHSADATAPPERLDQLDIGRAAQLAPSPRGPLLAVSNYRNELLLVDLEQRSMRLLDRSRYAAIRGAAWSPDGRWLAYSFYDTLQTCVIRLCEVATGTITPATRPVLEDVAPAWDPDGKYLYFLSYRDFDPVADQLQFDLGFPRGVRPFLITLQAEVRSPFVPQPRPLDKAPPKMEPPAPPPPAAEGDPASGEPKPAQPAPPPAETKPEPRIRIDLDGIADRVVAFPVPVGRYRQIAGLPGKVLFSSYPIEGTLAPPPGAPPARGKIECYDFESQSSETLIDGVSWFGLSADARTLVYRAGNRLRVLKAGEKPKDNSGEPSRKSGWIDLYRVRPSVSPPAEWAQMYREAWRLQRDHFWTPDMSGVDWQAVFRRYQPLLDRVATRAEFSDLLWEMQGELGTSHAYEHGGDYRPWPRYTQGSLGADLRYDPESDSYVVERLVRGDSWDPQAGSPLLQPGMNVRPGDRIVAVGGRRVGRDRSPHELLVHQGGTEVLLTIAGADGATRTVTVRTLADETGARYREWVEENRRRVHEATDGAVGYVHIPDMQPRGFAEFHRGFLAEVARQGLIVDVRYNAGGNVSPLIIEKLVRRRIGYQVSRWSEPRPYPSEAIRGPIVGLTNEWAGSDGDVASHVFRLLGIGPLIGKRTWGGVIGINPRDTLVDGGTTTQPEFSLWFDDAGWSIENLGVMPDIEVELRPQDFVAGRDPQLQRAIEEAQRLLGERPPLPPDFGDRPRLALPDASDE